MSKNNTNNKNNTNKAIIAARIKTLIDNGYIKIHTKDELSEYPFGSLICYVTIKGLFKKGGYLKSINNKNFDLDDIELENDEPISVPFDKVKTMYVGNPLKLTNRTKIETNFPVKIGDEIIYYAKDNFDKRRFKSTNRYKLLKKWYNLYGDDFEFN